MGIYFIRTVVLLCLFIIILILIDYIIKQYKKENVFITERDVEFVKGLITNDMLNFYIVSLISSDNENSEKQWIENKNRLIKLKKSIKKIKFDDKKHVLQQIQEGIKIINKELEKYN